jgi:hypothetical protein
VIRAAGNGRIARRECQDRSAVVFLADWDVEPRFGRADIDINEPWATALERITLLGGPLKAPDTRPMINP